MPCHEQVRDSIIEYATWRLGMALPTKKLSRDNLICETDVYPDLNSYSLDEPVMWCKLNIFLSCRQWTKLGASRIALVGILLQ